MFNVSNQVNEKAKDIDLVKTFGQAGQYVYVYDKTVTIQNSDAFKEFMNSVSTGIDTIKQKTDIFFRPEQNYMDDNKKMIIINDQKTPMHSNINNNNDIKANIPNEQNNNQNNLTINNNTGIIGNIVNKITEPKFKSNYSSINNDKNEHYDNYINEITENSTENKNEKNLVENKEHKINDNIINESNKEENKSNPNNSENDMDPNLLVMNNAPKND